MSMDPQISVIVPIYKVEKYLNQCIESIINQTFKDLEIILIDEGDHDACYAIMKLYEQEDPRVKIVHKKMGGYAFACNAGIDMARGKYISIIESDDFIEPTMYEDLWQRAENTNAEIVKCSFYNYRDLAKGNSIKETDPATTALSFLPETPFNILEYPHLMGIHPSIWAGIYRRDFLQNHRLKFNETKPQLYVDVVFRLQAFIEAERIVWVNKHLYNWRLTNPNSTNSNFNFAVMINRWKEILPLFDGKKQLFDAAAPYLLLESYHNLTSPMYNLGHATEERLADVQNILAKFGDDVIMNSWMDSQKISETMRVKHAKSLTELRSGILGLKRLPLRHYLYAILHTNIIIRHKSVFLNFLAGFHRQLLSIEFSLFRKFEFRLVLGRAISSGNY